MKSTLNTSSDLSSASLERKSYWLKKARHACHRIPPLWPLKNFVAVNPFVGLVGRPFTEVCELMERVTHEAMLAAPEYFKKQLASGRIASADLARALTLAPEMLPPAWSAEAAKLEVTDLTQWLHYPESTLARVAAPARVLTVADIADGQAGTARWNSLITDEIAKWCAAYFDEGQSAWRMPWKKLPLYAAWRQVASVDLNPELLGLQDFRSIVKSLPEDPQEAVSSILDELGVGEDVATDYLHRLLMNAAGWSAHVQFLVREQAMAGRHEETLVDLLVIRLAFEVSLLRMMDQSKLLEFWTQVPPSAQDAPSQSVLMLALWQLAMELGFQRRLVHDLTSAAAGGSHSTDQASKRRPAVQAVFCIDVRSEIMRRSLEALSPKIETLGFAGFFGLPIEYIPFGRRHGSAQCPVLLKPAFKVQEHLADATPVQEKKMLRRLQLGRRVKHSWNAFKTSAVSCFSFVETAGLGASWSLIQDTFGLRLPTSLSQKRLTPHLGHHHGHAEMGIAEEDQVRLAFGMLKSMGLTSCFARLVVLCGHGSSTVNNPYGSSLDCGACGGHAGEANARVGAMILNQKRVRKALVREHGIHIPDDTCFLAGLHDTTTDEIHLYDTCELPESHETDLQELQLWLGQAAMLNRRQRAPKLGLAGIPSEEIDSLVKQRGQDWSQVRPEWGLAGNAAFVVAPRERTKSLNLGGRVFLHNYNHAADADLSTLELIMTAPMIVTNWINLQYFASSVNNARWGSGNKAIHNVVGTFGVQQGNGGDLQMGLPLQSLHDGETAVHEPLRLTVIIEAPREAISGIIAKHEPVRQLVDNGWLHLMAMENEGQAIFRCLSGQNWLPA